MTQGDDLPPRPPARGLPAGTPVLTPAGPVPAEALRPGMLVLAVSGAAAPFQAVVAVRRASVPGPAVRIRAEALDDGTPQEDLLLPGDHALLLDGALVPAGALVDGHGILREAGDAPLPVVEILLAGHDALLAGGAAVESMPPADAPDCAPRRPPGAALRAMLAWRAERMGWAEPLPDPPPAAGGDFRERLAASAFPSVDLDLPAMEGEA